MTTETRKIPIWVAVKSTTIAGGQYKHVTTELVIGKGMFVVELPLHPKYFYNYEQLLKGETTETVLTLKAYAKIQQMLYRNHEIAVSDETIKTNSEEE